MEVHRVVPAESGGSDALTNHVLLCADCHATAHTDQRQQRN
jgi:5-methylcytosine-specific restriction endonuclease McrA